MLLFCVPLLGLVMYHPGGDCNVTVLCFSAGRMYHPGGDCNVTVLCFSTRAVGCIILSEIVMLLFCVSVLGAGRMYGRDCNVTVLCFSTRCWSDISSWWRL